MSREKLVIRDNSTLRAQYNSLQEGDIVVGRLRLRESEEPMLLDLGAQRSAPDSLRTFTACQPFKNLPGSTFFPIHVAADPAHPRAS